MIDIAVIGGVASLSDGVAARSDGVAVGEAVGEEVISAVFDDATDTWLLRRSSGADVQARVVVDGARRLHQPCAPDYPGHTDFHGPSLRWPEQPGALDAAGQRVAVVGNRAAHVVGVLNECDVLLFDYPLNWQNAKRRRLRAMRRPEVAPSPVEEITRSGIRTADGRDYRVDAIIFATGCSVIDDLPQNALVGLRRLTIQQAWKDSATAYLGIAVHGFPNYFMTLGPDSPAGDRETVTDTQVRYIASCIQQMRRRGGSRIEVRRSAQLQFTERARVKGPASAFELGSPDADHQIYDGPATLTVAGGEQAVRVRLTGHLDPIDGKYHWQGTVFGAELAPGSGQVRLAIDSHGTPARITEQTPWGSHSIAGAGAPPFALG